MSLDLRFAEDLLDRLVYDDLVEIHAPTGGSIGGALDPDTGMIVPDTGTLLWAGAACIIAGGSSTVPLLLEQAGVETTEARAMCIGPLGIPQVPAESTLTVVGSRRPGGPRDPEIIGATFRITEVPQVNTLAVYRRLYLEAVDQR